MAYTAIKNRLQGPDNDVSVAYPEWGRGPVSVSWWVSMSDSDAWPSVNCVNYVRPGERPGAPRGLHTGG